MRRGRTVRRNADRDNARMKEDLQQAAMALLNRHWITKRKDPELFIRVKDHYEALRDWFHDRAGLSLILTRSFVKLEKIPGSFQPWMGIRSFYSPRDYALFTYGLWYLEGCGNAEQFLLSEMVDAIRDHMLSMDVLMDWTLYEHRLSMARALKKLRELDVLVSVEGEETDWAREGGYSNVLYEASPMARYILRRFSKELMSYTSMEDLIVPQTAATLVANSATAASEVQGRRHIIFRRLMQEPVVYDWQWTEDERRYVLSQRSGLLEQMRGMLGLEGRRFREGLMFTWPELSGEMDLFPTLAGQTDLLLLFAGELRRVVQAEPTFYERDDHGNYVLTRAEFEGLLMRLKQYHGDYWSKDHRLKTSSALADELVQHMEDWNLGSRQGEYMVKIYPSLARWNGNYDWEAGEHSVG
jgi:uncharacterized protein (TIGR02678 family)